MKQSDLPLSRLGPLTIKIGSGVTPPGGESSYVPDGIPLIRSQNVLDGRLDLRGVANISSEQHASMSNSVVRPSDVLLNITGASIGRTCIVPNDLKIANVNQHVCIIRCGKQLLPQFLFQYLSSDSGQKQIDLCQAGGNRQGLNYQQIAGFQIPLPAYNEQFAICRILSSWDQGIRQFSDLISAKLAAREGLVQQLFSGRLRVKKYKNSVHELVALNTILAKVSNPVVLSPNELYREIGVRSHGKGVFHKEPVTGATLGNKRVYRVVPGCLTLNIVFAWERAVAITTDSEEGMIASHRFPMFLPKADRLLCEYALLFLLSKAGAEALELASPGGAGRNRTLSQTAFLKNRIPLPSLSEQHRVVSLVQAADREIELLREQLELLKLQKKGLMQKLLTGQVRVKLPKGAK